MIIRIKNLTLVTNIGIYQWEKNYPRTLVFNAEIETSFDDKNKSDDIKNVIDYDAIIEKIKNFVESNYCQLIERMAEEILEIIMQDKRIERCTLEIDKCKLYDFLDSCSITKTKYQN